MALSTVIFVGESKDWLPDIVEKARKLTVGSGFDSKTDVGQIDLYNFTNIHTCIHTYINIYSHTHTYIHTYIYIHTYMQ